MDLLASKVGLIVVATIIAQESELISLTEGIGYGIIGAAMILAWRVTNKAQKDAFETRLESQTKAEEIKDAIIVELRAEIKRLREQLETE